MTFAFDDSLRKFVYIIMDLKEIIIHQLEHGRELEVFYIDPKDIKVFFFVWK